MYWSSEFPEISWTFGQQVWNCICKHHDLHGSTGANLLNPKLETPIPGTLVPWNFGAKIKKQILFWQQGLFQIICISSSHVQQTIMTPSCNKLWLYTQATKHWFMALIWATVGMLRPRHSLQVKVYHRGTMSKKFVCINDYTLSFNFCQTSDHAIFMHLSAELVALSKHACTTNMTRSQILSQAVYQLVTQIAAAELIGWLSAGTSVKPLCDAMALVYTNKLDWFRSRSTT